MTIPKIVARVILHDGEITGLVVVFATDRTRVLYEPEEVAVPLIDWGWDLVADPVEGLEACKPFCKSCGGFETLAEAIDDCQRCLDLINPDYYEIAENTNKE